MEANVFIKSIKTEGNKITDIQFDGDWEIDLAGTGTVTGGQVVPYNNPQGIVECWKEFEDSHNMQNLELLVESFYYFFRQHLMIQIQNITI